MPTITIRLKSGEKADLESAARASGQSVSEYVRETLNLREQQDHLDRINGEVQTLRVQVQRLEEIAGLS